jgi:hypothetical protein
MPIFLEKACEELWVFHSFAPKGRWSHPSAAQETLNLFFEFVDLAHKNYNYSQLATKSTVMWLCMQIATFLRRIRLIADRQ